MNKTELIAAVAAAAGVSKKDAAAVIDATVDTISNAVAAGDKELAQQTYTQAVKKIDQAVAHGILHKNNAARKKSRFTNMLNSMNG